MKEINPTIAISVAVVAVLVAGVVIWRTMAPSAAPQQPAMPSNITAEINQRMSGATGAGRTAPPSGNPGTTAPMPGGMTGPGAYMPAPGSPVPNGTPGGYIQPPSGR